MSCWLLLQSSSLSQVAIILTPIAQPSFHVLAVVYSLFHSLLHTQRNHWFEASTIIVDQNIVTHVASYSHSYSDVKRAYLDEIYQYK